MKKLMVLFFGLSVSFASIANESKRESVEALLHAANADAMVDSIYAQMDQVFAGMGQQLGVEPDQQEAFDHYIAKVVELMKEELSWDKMKKPMIDIYLEHYTEKEIQDILNFYQSESGRSMVEKMPAVMKDSMQLSQNMMQSFFPKMQSMTVAFKKDLDEQKKQE